jgi:hypothetical protein
VVSRVSWERRIAGRTRDLYILPLFCLFLLLGCLLNSANSGPKYSNVLVSPPGLSAAIEDFDGDLLADLASVQSVSDNSWPAIYTVQIRLHAGRRQSIKLVAPPGGLLVAARDVNGDHVPDLIVSSAWPGKPLAILLNDGKGRFSWMDPRSFPEVSNPERALSWQPPTPTDTVARSLQSAARDFAAERSSSRPSSAEGFLSRPRSAVDLNPLLVSLPRHAPPQAFPA